LDPVGSYYKVRTNGDENLDWNLPSRQVFNFVRAICEPGPQATSLLYGKEVKINRVQLLTNTISYEGIPGSIMCIEPEAFIVKTADGVVRVTQWTGCPLPKIGDKFH